MSVIVSKIDKIGPKSFLDDVIGRKKLEYEKKISSKILQMSYGTKVSGV